MMTLKALRVGALLLLTLPSFTSVNVALAQSTTPTPTPNGISVGRPKVFDNRTLTLMLESLSESLRNVQSQFIDQKALAAAFNFLQGSRTRESISSLSVSPLPIPSLKQENINSTGNAAASGTPLPDTTKQTTTSERSSFTPQPPAFDTMSGFPAGFNPSFGTSPSDLLSDQVNLTYQIFNLRMLLERSLTDRLLQGGSTRRQAVLGFNVTLDPPRTANDAVAVVEIRLTASEGCSSPDDCLSLVSLMPQEKTYNAAALSSKSRAFAGAAVANVFQVGFSERHRGQTFYLYRDNDTISYERMVAGQLIFGWMFRPVLGRHSISPGLRQLFAIVSLPSSDTTRTFRGTSDSLPDTSLRAQVTTYWKKYDSATMTSFQENEANRASRFKNAILFGLTKPELFSDRYTNRADYENIKVKATEDYQSGLTPRVDSVSWSPVGPKSVLISIHGNNFFTGTQVALGDKTYSTNADGLIIKSNQALDMLTGLDALATGSGAIIGRYGAATSIIGGNETSGIAIQDVRIGPSLSGNHSVEIDLSSASGTSLQLSDLPKVNPDSSTPTKNPRVDNGPLTPMVVVNGNVAQLPYSIVTAPGIKLPNGQSINGLTIQAIIPDAYLSKGGGIVKVSWPFRSESWTATSRFWEPTYNVVRLGAKRIVITTADPLGFKSISSSEPCWMLLANESPVIRLPSSTCTKGNAAATAISDHAVDITISPAAPDKVVLVSPNRFSFTLDVPKAAGADSGKPKTIVLNQCDSVWKDVATDDIAKVVTVEANGLSLKWLPSPPDKDGNPVKTITVELTGKLTRNPGNVDLSVFDKDGKVLVSVPIQINPNPLCRDKGESQ